MEIYAVRMGEKLKEDRFIELLSYLPKEKQERIQRFRRFEDAQRALIAEILVRDTLCARLKCKNEELLFGANEFGKPFVIGFEGAHYNVSHSGSFVVGGFDREPLGIDVERIHSVDLTIAKRFFSQQEFLDLSALAERDKLRYFFDLWTLKESYIKLDGRGLHISLGSFTMKREKESFFVKTENPIQDCSFRQYEIDPEYKLSVCSISADFPEHLRVLEEEALWEQFIRRA